MTRSPQSAIDALFLAHRAVAEATQGLLDVPHDDLVSGLADALATARALADEDESSRRFLAIADVLAELEGPRVAELLVDLLDVDDLEACGAAGEALVGLASERFKEVAQVVERHLANAEGSSRILRELAYVFAAVPEASSAKLLEKFLQHRDPEVVAAGIEALVDIGEPSTARALEALKRDKREVSVEDDNEEVHAVTLGELAQEALTLIRGGGRG